MERLFQKTNGFENGLSERDLSIDTLDYFSNPEFLKKDLGLLKTAKSIIGRDALLPFYVKVLFTPQLQDQSDTVGYSFTYNSYTDLHSVKISLGPDKLSQKKMKATIGVIIGRLIFSELYRNRGNSEVIQDSSVDVYVGTPSGRPSSIKEQIDEIHSLILDEENGLKSGALDYASHLFGLLFYYTVGAGESENAKMEMITKRTGFGDAFSSLVEMRMRFSDDISFLKAALQLIYLETNVSVKKVNLSQFRLAPEQRQDILSVEKSGKKMAIAFEVEKLNRLKKRILEFGERNSTRKTLVDDLKFRIVSQRERLYPSLSCSRAVRR